MYENELKKWVIISVAFIVVLAACGGYILFFGPHNTNLSEPNSVKTINSNITKNVTATPKKATQVATKKATTPKAAASTPSVPVASTPTAAPVDTVYHNKYQLHIDGPTTINAGDSGTWTVSDNNGRVTSQDLDGHINWIIDGRVLASHGVNLQTDAMGSETTWSPYGAHTLTAQYTGDTLLPSTTITVTSFAPVIPTATPKATVTPTEAPTLTWASSPQAPVIQGGSAFYMAYYNSHTTGGSGKFFTPQWSVDGTVVATNSPASSYASYGFDTTHLSVGTHTVTFNAPEVGMSISATLTVIK